MSFESARGMIHTDRDFVAHKKQATRGSRKLRNAIFRSFGFKVPSKPKKHRPYVPVLFPKPCGRKRGSTPDQIGQIRNIQHLVSRVCRVRVENLRTSQRRKSAHARHLAMYVSRHAVGVSYPEIGKAFGRDHSTVIYGVREVQKRIDAHDLRMIRALQAIHAMLP